MADGCLPTESGTHRPSEVSRAGIEQAEALRQCIDVCQWPVATVPAPTRRTSLLRAGKFTFVSKRRPPGKLESVVACSLQSGWLTTG
jgi:hypothetical protein